MKTFWKIKLMRFGKIESHIIESFSWDLNGLIIDISSRIGGLQLSEIISIEKLLEADELNTFDHREAA